MQSRAVTWTVAWTCTRKSTHTHDVSPYAFSRTCMYFRCRGSARSRNARVDEASRLFSRDTTISGTYLSTTDHYGLIISITPYADRSYNHNRATRVFLSFSRQVLPRGSIKNTPTLQLNPLILARDDAVRLKISYYIVLYILFPNNNYEIILQNYSRSHLTVIYTIYWQFTIWLEKVI